MCTPKEWFFTTFRFVNRPQTENIRQKKGWFFTTFRRAIIKKLPFFFLFVFWTACSDKKEETESLYGFPTLPYEQLVQLKRASEKIEGFFLTTNLSDLDPSFAARGLYLYVCVRFLNDPAVNSKLKKSAVPLLIQVSVNDETAPAAESVVLFHPQTLKADNQTGIFYYEERQKFQLKDKPIVLRGKEYNIFDVAFNEQSRIHQMSFIKKGAKWEDLDRPALTAQENEDSENTEEPAEDGETEERDKKYQVLWAGGFAKKSSGSCEDWDRLNYQHSTDVPDYLKPPAGSATADTSGQGAGAADHSSRLPAPSSPPLVQAPKPIPENTPYTPIQKNKP